MTQEQTLEYIKNFEDKSRIRFIEQNLSTYDASKGYSHGFKIFPRQKEFLKSLGANENTIAIKHRQAGITTITSAWITAQIAFASKDHPETILCIGNKMDLAEQLVEKIKAFLVQVPRWYWGEDFEKLSDKEFLKTLFVKQTKDHIELCNGCKVYARSSGENSSRGISAVSILVFDEAGFIENGTSVYASAVASSSTVKNRKIIMISTPNGKDALYYNTYQQALAKENNYNAVEFRWFQDPRFNKNLIWRRKNSENKEEIFREKTIDIDGSINYDEEHWKQMEKDGWSPSSPWYESMKQTFNNDSVKIAQELDVSFLGSANNVVPQDAIEMQRNLNVRNPLTDFTDPLEEGTWFWKRPINGHRYLMAIDCARGDGADRTAIEMIDIDGTDDTEMPILEQVMEYYGKKPADLVGELAYRYGNLYNSAFCVIDCIGGVGDPTALKLRAMGYKNLYYDDNTLKDYTRDNIVNGLTPIDNGRLPGFHSSSVRFQMLSKFASMVRMNEFKIRSVRVINELETWIFKKETGRMDHQSGKHDDTLTCLAMGLFVLEYSLNRINAEKSMDASILKAYCTSNTVRAIDNTKTNYQPKQVVGLPTRGTANRQSQINPFLWVLKTQKKR